MWLLYRKLSKIYDESLGSDCMAYPEGIRGGDMDLKLELIAVPVTDVDRAKAFYEKVGFNPDHDHTVSENLRFVQLTPPGSACSICIGKGLTDLNPGSIDMIVLVVADADAVRDELRSRGIDASEVDEQPWGRFVHITDPDGNKWSLQELPKRN
jgi:predicted enzyme related to lactoylglutathione lyase